MLKRYTHEKDGYLRESDSGEWVKYDDIGKNALEPVATVTVRSIGGDTVDTIPGRDYVLAQDAAAIIAQYSIRDGALRAQLEFLTTSVDDERSLRIRFEQRVANLRAQLAAKDAELKLAWQTNTEVILREQLTATQSRITELEKEAEENARIIGMSGEREAKHLSMIEQRDRRIAELEAAMAGSGEPVAWLIKQDGRGDDVTMRDEVLENAKRFGCGIFPLVHQPDAALKSAPTPDPRDARIKELEAALAVAESWLSSSPHGDNCFVSDNYEGDPGDRCNCGKDSLLAHIDAALKGAPTTSPISGEKP